MLKNKKAFTLIELLAVIIILGILMIIAIPAVTSYISESRKSAYIDSARELIAGTRNLVNTGKLNTYDADTTYYVPTKCIPTETGGQSPYGEFTQAYIGVIYEGDNFRYYWISVDDSGHGISKITPYNKLDTDNIESNLKESDITNIVTTTGIGNRSEIKILNCDTKKWDTQYHLDDIGDNYWDDDIVDNMLASSIVLSNSSNSLYNIPSTNIYIFRGSNPSNYVRFNDEIWRIVGIYGKSIKLIKHTNIGYYKYDVSNANRARWEGSSLEKYLNQNTTGGYYYSLSSNAKKMISTGSWDVVKTAYDSYLASSSKKYSAKIGMIAVYEFMYASSGTDCYNEKACYYYTSCGKSTYDWLTPSENNIWTISYYDNDNIIAAASVMSIGFATHTTVDNRLGVKPSVMLNAFVKIISGTGTLTDPYILGI